MQYAHITETMATKETIIENNLICFGISNIFIKI